jgi:outer membrane protein OmpA-like peptidoglycan-associated protein
VAHCPSLVPFLFLLGLAAVPSLGLAQETYQPQWKEDPDARNAAFDGNAYRLVSDGLGILTVQSGQVLEHLQFDLHLSFHYAYDNMVFARDPEASAEGPETAPPVAETEEGEVVYHLVKHRVESHLAAGLGLYNLLDVGFQLPIIWHQQASFPAYNMDSVATPDTIGVGNLLTFVKLRAPIKKKVPIALALTLPLYFPTGNEEAYMGYDGWGFAPTIAFSARIKAVLLALNVGYLLQPENSLWGTTDDDKLTMGLGVAYAPEKGRIEAGLEATCMTNVFDMFGKVRETQAEIGAGLKIRIKDFKLILGAGKGLVSGFMTPNFRFFVGLEYSRKPDPDKDKDGIPNLSDSCPTSPEDMDGFQDQDGCPDPDNDEDRIPDKADSCPNEPEDLDTFADQDGCPDPDNDNDAIPDPADQCPNQAEDFDKFQDEDGCPELDNDGDGIPDEKDKCPNEKETFNDYQDEDGCPDKKLAELSKEARKIEILDKVHFKFMSAELDPTSFPLLDQVVQILKDNPHVRFVQVEGHTDKTGAYQFNLQLSQERAQSVVNYLVSKGVESNRLRAQGYGDTRRIDYRSGPEANLNNRRVEFNVLKLEEPAPK